MQRGGLSFAFGGAMYAWPYMCGVATYAQRLGLVSPDARLYATSAGSIAAVLLACGVDIENHGLAAGLASNDLHVARGRTPFFKPRVIMDSLQTFVAALPDNAHELASGRLFITVTQVRTGRRLLLSRYRTRDDLVHALSATMSIPGHAVRFAHPVPGVGLCIDGGLRGDPPSDERRGWRTIHVSVRGRRSRAPRRLASLPDICPHKPLPLSSVLTVQSEARRRALFARGRSDARVYFASQRATLASRPARSGQAFPAT